MGERMMATLAPPAAEQNSPVREPERFSAALHRYWGYESFRPGQESIVKSIAAGRDACVVMPTGGGKSLCYQLPAVLDATTAVVISPLIALMQDQVAQLLQMGISAACLNAATPSEERNHILHHARTASPTRRVRHDIIEQLRLRDPHKHIASFRRPNLRYIVRQCDSRTQNELLLRAVRQVSDGSVIVYAPTIARVGDTVDLLEENGIAAIGYHGQMESAARRENQEKWMADEVRVMVGTMAFGLGINKAAVRAVIHLSLPKSVEQYYQEAGRAGRDTLPADCFLFWQKKDTGLHAFFIGKIEDAAEKERAWQRYHEVEKFVQSTECRQRHVCQHFGEIPKWEFCGNCDACAATPDWLEIELQSPRRKRDAIRKPQTEHSPAPRSAAARPVMAAVKTSSDIELKEYLREWRRVTAREKGVAAFIVLPDSALVDLCLAKPSSLVELRRVSGFGDKRVEMYGKEVLDALRRFREGERASDEGKAKASSPAKETVRLLEEGRTFEEIAQIRQRTLRAVVSLVADLIERGEAEFQAGWMAPDRYNEIAAACREFGMDRLKPLKEALPAEIPYEEIRLVIASLRAN